MIQDRQVRRWIEARARQHAAAQHLRVAQHEHDGANAELITAGAALAERVRLLTPTGLSPARRSA